MQFKIMMVVDVIQCNIRYSTNKKRQIKLKTYCTNSCYN